MRDLHAFLEANGCEFLKFERVENKRSSRRDIHAFILLNEILPGDRGMVCAAGHDEIYLEVDPNTLNECATDEQLIELIRCGVRYDSSCDSLAMFV